MVSSRLKHRVLFTGVHDRDFCVKDTRKQVDVSLNSDVRFYLISALRLLLLDYEMALYC